MMFPVYYLACILAMLGSVFLLAAYVAHKMASDRKAAQYDKQGNN